MRKVLMCLQLIAVSAGLFIGAPASAQTPAAPTAPAAAPAPAKMQFLMKLIPPRSTFPADITPEETALMTKHFAYWQEQFKTGKVLIIGPVMDPKGAWGMAVLETASLAKAQQMADNDPSVKGGLNKVELSPMHISLRKQ